MSCLHRLSWPWSIALPAALALTTSAALAQLPSASEIEAAMIASAPIAKEGGLVWRTQRLWVEALRQRTPLLAAHHLGACHLGYSAYTPGRDYRWLFPALEQAQRSAWLAGMLLHELAHCAEQADASAIAPAGAAPPVATAQQQEVLADLAFALHVDAQGRDGVGLVALLASLRGSHAAQDPTHDTASALHCYLRQRGHFHPQGDWLSRLKAWRRQCAPALPAPRVAAADIDFSALAAASAQTVAQPTAGAPPW